MREGRQGNYGGQVVFTSTSMKEIWGARPLYNMPRAALVQATRMGSVWAMTDKTLWEDCAQECLPKEKDVHESFLENVRLLESTRNTRGRILLTLSSPRLTQQGSPKVKQGDRANGMYFVEAGTLGLKQIEGDEKKVQRDSTRRILR